VKFDIFFNLERKKLENYWSDFDVISHSNVSYQFYKSTKSRRI